MQQSVQCRRCGAQYVYGQRFCSQCGEQFEYHCPNCSTVIQPDFVACPNCGFPLKEDLQRQQGVYPVEQTHVESPTQHAQRVEEKDVIPYEEKSRWYTNPSKKKVFVLLAIFVVIILLIVAIFAIDTYFPRQSDAAPAKAPPQSESSRLPSTIPGSSQITARDLYLAYTTAKNEAAATYDNQSLTVTGVIEVSGILSDNRHFIILAGGIDDLGVHCTLTEELSNEAGQLEEGQSITIQGTCSGYSGTHVRLSDCFIAN